MIISGKTNTNAPMLEALKLCKIDPNTGGPSKAFPDGSAEGSMRGTNKAIEVVVSYAADYNTRSPYYLQVTFLDDDEIMLFSYHMSGSEALRLGENLLKQVNDPMYDPKKIAKKYRLQMQRI